MKIIAMTIQITRTSQKLVTQNISPWKETLSKKLGFSVNPTALTLLSKVRPCTIILVQDRFSSNRPTGPIRSSSRDVHIYIYLSVCPLSMRVFFRPLIGQHRSHDYFQGLSLVTAPRVKIECINRTIFVLEHSILTLGASDVQNF